MRLLACTALLALCLQGSIAGSVPIPALKGCPSDCTQGPTGCNRKQITEPEMSCSKGFDFDARKKMCNRTIYPVPKVPKCPNGFTVDAKGKFCKKEVEVPGEKFCPAPYVKNPDPNAPFEKKCVKVEETSKVIEKTTRKTTCEAEAFCPDPSYMLKDGMDKKTGRHVKNLECMKHDFADKKVIKKDVTEKCNVDFSCPKDFNLSKDGNECVKEVIVNPLNRVQQSWMTCPPVFGCLEGYTLDKDNKKEGPNGTCMKTSLVPKVQKKKTRKVPCKSEPIKYCPKSHHLNAGETDWFGQDGMCVKTISRPKDVETVDVEKRCQGIPTCPQDFVISGTKCVSLLAVEKVPRTRIDNFVCDVHKLCPVGYDFDHDKDMCRKKTKIASKCGFAGYLGYWGDCVLSCPNDCHEDGYDCMKHDYVPHTPACPDGCDKLFNGGKMSCGKSVHNTDLMCPEDCHKESSVDGKCFKLLTVDIVWQCPKECWIKGQPRPPHSGSHHGSHHDGSYGNNDPNAPASGEAPTMGGDSTGDENDSGAVQPAFAPADGTESNARRLARRLDGAGNKHWQDEPRDGDCVQMGAKYQWSCPPGFGCNDDRKEAMCTKTIRRPYLYKCPAGCDDHDGSHEHSHHEGSGEHGHTHEGSGEHHNTDDGNYTGGPGGMPPGSGIAGQDGQQEGEQAPQESEAPVIETEESVPAAESMKKRRMQDVEGVEGDHSGDAERRPDGFGDSGDDEQEPDEADEHYDEKMMRRGSHIPKCEAEEEYTDFECPEGCQENTEGEGGFGRDEGSGSGRRLADLIVNGGVPPRGDHNGKHDLSDKANMCVAVDFKPAIENMCPAPCSWTVTKENGKQCGRNFAETVHYCPQGFTDFKGMCKKVIKTEKIPHCPTGCTLTKTLTPTGGRRLGGMDDHHGDDEGETEVGIKIGDANYVSCTRVVKKQFKECPAGFKDIEEYSFAGADSVSANNCIGEGCPAEVGYKAVKGECVRKLTMNPEYRCPLTNGCKKDLTSRTLSCYSLVITNEAKCPSQPANTPFGDRWMDHTQDPSCPPQKCIRKRYMPFQTRCPAKLKDNTPCAEVKGKCIATTTAPVVMVCPTDCAEDTTKGCIRNESVFPAFNCPAKCTLNKDKKCEGFITVPWEYKCPGSMKLTGTKCY